MPGVGGSGPQGLGHRDGRHRADRRSGRERRRGRRRADLPGARFGSDRQRAFASVREAVRGHHIIGLDSRGLAEVAVTRAARAITAKDVESRILLALAGKFGLPDASNLAVVFDNDVRTFVVEPTATSEARGDPSQLRAAHHPPSTSRSSCRAAWSRAAFTALHRLAERDLRRVGADARDRPGPGAQSLGSGGSSAGRRLLPPPPR